MKLFYLSQSLVDGYDTFSDAVVAAESCQEARQIHPNAECGLFENGQWPDWHNDSWAPPDSVVVKLLGEAVEGIEAGVICASFHAG